MQPTATGGTGSIQGRSVVQEPSCASIFGCRGVAAALCIGGGGTCLAVAPYMTTPESMAISYGSAALCSAFGSSVGGREFYIARLAKSLAEGIEDLKETHTALQGTVGALQGEVTHLEEAITLLTETRNGLNGEVDILKAQNKEFKSNNTVLQGQIEQSGKDIDAQTLLLKENEAQIKKNEELISEREAQAIQAKEGLTHFATLLKKAEISHEEKQVDLEAVTGRLEEVSSELDEQLDSVKAAREELEQRIPLLEKSAMQRVQVEAENLREKQVEAVTNELSVMRIEEREAARAEAKEIRDGASEEAKTIRDLAAEEQREGSDRLDERTALLSREQEALTHERDQMAEVEAGLRNEIKELNEQLSGAAVSKSTVEGV